MAIIKLYNNGITGGKPGRNITNHQKRSNTKGWSPAVSRRMTKWLYSVGIPNLTGSGYSFTFTVKECPPSPSDWSDLVHNLTTKRFKRLGVVRYQWLTEWQSRGVPHLHGCVYFDNEVSHHKLIALWIDLAKRYGAKIQSQNVKPIYDDIGWYKYLSKHAVRGTLHYQRNNANIPPEWNGITGRMWGKGGDWGVTEPLTFELDNLSWARFKRIIRSYRKAKSRAHFQSQSVLQDPYKWLMAKRNISKSRRILKSSSKTLSEIRGVNEFFDYDTAIKIMLHLSTYKKSEIIQN